MQRKERRVLIVDDSPEDCGAVRRYLAQSQDVLYRVREEQTGTSGLAACQAAVPDCLLLDYALPDLDGLDFLDTLIRCSGSLPCPVVMLTGRGNELVAVQALKRGAEDYLIKGQYTAQTLQQTVEDAIEKA